MPRSAEERARPVGLIVAGGRGTRMDDPRPKPLVTVGGRALVERNAARLVATGVTEIWFALHHRADEIVAHLEANLPQVTRPTWVVETRPLGTIGALAKLTADERGRGRTVIALNGDLFSGIDLAVLLERHRGEDADLTIATHEETHRLELGQVVSDERGAVTAYLEKPEKRFRISSGTYAIEPSIAETIADGEAIGIPDLVRRALDAGQRVLEHPDDRPWVDVNDSEDLERAERFLSTHPELFRS